MKIEEACAASTTGIAHGYDADGVYQFAAQGASLAPWPPLKGERRSKHVIVWPALMEAGQRQLIPAWTPHLHRKLFRLKPDVRTKLDALIWKPVRPIDIVTALAKGKRR